MKIELDSTAITDEEIDATINLLRSWKKGGSLCVPTPHEGNVNPAATANFGLSGDEIESFAQGMHAYALVCSQGSEYKTADLYRYTFQGKKWSILSSDDRKAIGRTFRRMAREHFEEANTGEVVVVFKERNAQNMAIYRVTVKPATA